MIKRNKLKDDIKKKKIEIANYYFTQDKEIFEMRYAFSGKFFEEWKIGF